MQVNSPDKSNQSTGVEAPTAHTSVQKTTCNYEQQGSSMSSSSSSPSCLETIINFFKSILDFLCCCFGKTESVTTVTITTSGTTAPLPEEPVNRAASSTSRFLSRPASSSPVSSTPLSENSSSEEWSGSSDEESDTDLDSTSVPLADPFSFPLANLSNPIFSPALPFQPLSSNAHRPSTLSPQSAPLVSSPPVQLAPPSSPVFRPFFLSPPPETSSIFAPSRPEVTPVVQPAQAVLTEEEKKQKAIKILDAIYKDRSLLKNSLETIGFFVPMTLFHLGLDEQQFGQAYLHILLSLEGDKTKYLSLNEERIVIEPWMIKHLFDKMSTAELALNTKEKPGLFLHYAQSRETATYLLGRCPALFTQKNWVGGTPLHTAVENDNLEVAKVLVEKDGILLVPKNNGETPLHLAKSKEMALLLFQRSSDVLFEKDKADNTPLHTAVKENRLSVAELLIEKSIDLSEPFNNSGHNPFSLCQSTAMVDLFLKKEPGLLNKKDKGGAIPLHRVEKAEIAAYLIEKGADIESKNHAGQTPLCTAVIIQNGAVANVLLDKGAKLDFSITDAQSKTEPLLHYLMENRSGDEWVKVCQKVLAKSVTNINVDTIIDSKGRTLFVHAIEKGATAHWPWEIAHILIDKQANLDNVKIENEPLLHYLLGKSDDNDHRRLFNKVLDAKSAQIHDIDSQGRTLFVHAIEKGATAHWPWEIAHILIDKQANLDNVKIENEPLLHYLLGKSDDKDHRGLFNKVLDAKPAQIHDIDSQGKTLFVHAIEKGATSHWPWEIAHVLIEKGVNLDNVTINKEPLLHYLLGKSGDNDHRGLFNKVLDAKPAQIHDIDSQGKTLFVHAIEKGATSHWPWEIAHVLIDKGANLDNLKIKNEPLLHYLLGKSDDNNDHRRLFNKVLDAKPAQIHDIDSQGKTLFVRAIEKGVTSHWPWEIAHILIDKGANLDNLKIKNEPLLHYLLGKSGDNDHRGLFNKVLDAKPAQIHDIDSQNRSLLVYAIEKGATSHWPWEIAHVLIDKGANLDNLKIKNEPLLHYLLEESNDGDHRGLFNKVLDKKSAQIDDIDSQNRTLLVHALVKSTSNTWAKEIAGELIAKGAGTNVSMPNGMSLKDFAKNNGLNIQGL